jgi:hypothetical protein
MRSDSRYRWVPARRPDRNPPSHVLALNSLRSLFGVLVGRYARGRSGQVAFFKRKK